MACKIMLHKLNPQIVCKLCKGYFIDPVTISECLHSCEEKKRNKKKEATLD